MRAESDPAIAVAGLTKRFGPEAAIEDVTFDVKSGEIFGLIGPDGAGKTTILRLISGVMAPDAGAVIVAGADVVAQPESVRDRVSYMPQRFGLYEDLTVDENIRFFAEVFAVPGRTREERAARLLSASGMMAFRKRLAGQLSGGMKQKLGLACALVHAPRIVLLDEPTTGVDPVSRREFWEILYGLRSQGVTMLISTAYFDEAERCDRLALLDSGRLRYCESPSSLRARMPGALLEVQTADAHAARAVVAGLSGVVSVLMVGEGLHVHADDAAAGPRIAQALDARQVAHGDIHQVTPGVEDLYVALLGSDASRGEASP
ncbi:MAG TPA: ABC transporter ATP-binding protein [Steroidobacteraceae bacterium]|nr:ABC transporter ATP-binding protein [Steroidobacteraceae bacterium]